MWGRLLTCRLRVGQVANLPPHAAGWQPAPHASGITESLDQSLPRVPLERDAPPAPAASVRAPLPAHTCDRGSLPAGSLLPPSAVRAAAVTGRTAPG